MRRGLVILGAYQPGAVKKYRFNNALRYDMGIEWDVLDISELEYENDETFGMLRAIGHWWQENPGPWDIVWTGDHHDEVAGFCDELRDSMGAEIVVDVDDLFHRLPKGYLASLTWSGIRRERYKRMLETADRRICSTPYLAEEFDGELAENFIIPEEWTQTPKQKDGVLILVPTGSARGQEVLDIERSLRTALEVPGVRVAFASSVWPQWSRNYPMGKVARWRWAPVDQYPRVMRRMGADILVSPMRHNDFNLAKSNLKWLEAGALGCAFLGERWGEYERTVWDGVTGVLAEGEKEWTEALMELIENRKLREKIATQGQTVVNAEWTWEHRGKAWTEGVTGNGNSGKRTIRSSEHGRRTAVPGGQPGEPAGVRG